MLPLKTTAVGLAAVTAGLGPKLHAAPAGRRRCNGPRGAEGAEGGPEGEAAVLLHRPGHLPSAAQLAVRIHVFHSIRARTWPSMLPSSTSHVSHTMMCMLALSQRDTMNSGYSAPLLS